jgi:hypothetical protein
MAARPCPGYGMNVTGVTDVPPCRLHAAMPISTLVSRQLEMSAAQTQNAPLENRDSQALGCMNETRRTRYCMAESTASSFFCRARLPSYAMGIVGRVSEAIIGSGRGPCSFMTLCSLSLTIKQDIKDLCVGGLDDRVMVACQTTH